MLTRNLLCAALTAICLGMPLAASPLDDAVSLDVLPGWGLPNGQRMAALHLTLAPGWKTYWRAPGDAGIPPQFDWRGVRNADAITVSWPTPEVFYEYGMRSIGYTQELVLPLTIAPKEIQAPIRLKGRMMLGICSDVCVPHTLMIDAILPAPDTTPSPKIVAALAAMPYSEKEASVRSATCQIAPTEDGMRIEVNVDLPHTGGEEVAVIEPGVPGVWTSEPRTTRAGQTLSAVSEMMHMEASVFSVNRSDIRITVIGDNYAVDIQGCTGG